MQKIVLISCVSKKAPYKTKAENLYVSPLFKGNLRYAKSQNPDRIFILSAKYGLVELDREIEPYNITLKVMSTAEVKLWANDVLTQLRSYADLQNDHFVFLAGAIYRKYLIPHLASFEAPLAGMPIGKQLQFHARGSDE